MALVDCHGAWRHLEATLGSVLGGILKDPHFSLGLSVAQIGLGATIYLIGQVMLIFRGWVPESPRWLVTHGHAAEAEKTVEDVEKMVSGDRYSSQLKKVEHLRHPWSRRHLNLFEIFGVLDHHINKIFGVPKSFQNRFSFRFPVFIGRGAKLVRGSGLNDLDILGIWRIGFIADLVDQLKR
jgi:hypothetical protein